jgi:protein TonB
MSVVTEYKQIKTMSVIGAVRHWSPSLFISILLNVIFLYVFTWLLVAQNYKAPEKGMISVLLVNNPKTPSPADTRQKPQPQPKKTVEKKIESIKPKPEQKPPLKKKTLINKKSIPKVKPETKPEPVKKVEEQPVIAQPSLAKNNEQKEEQDSVDKPVLDSKPAKQAVDVMPLFRLTRMPKIMEYDLEGFYPKEELDFGREATVLASVLLDKNGDVLEVEIIESAGNRFDEAAKEALFAKKIKIQPGYVGEKPVASRVRIPVKFEIKR